MIDRIAFLLLCSFALAAQKNAVPLDESGKVGVLEVLIVNSLGEPLRERVSGSIERLEDGKPVSQTCAGHKATLKYGTYKLKVRSPGAYPVDKLIRIADRA